jgi:nucleoid DNA-binding protein
LVSALAQTAITDVKKNGIVMVPGIGRLVHVDRPVRMGRNPTTGEAIKIPAKKVKFRVARAAKDAILPSKAKQAQALTIGPDSVTAGLRFRPLHVQCLSR